MRTYIGIDPGLRNTGWGIVGKQDNRLIFIASGTISTSSNVEIGDRLLKIFEELSLIVQKHNPCTAAIEDTYVNLDAKNSLKLAHARGVALLCLKQAALELVEYPAKTVKKTICGSGRADKRQVTGMLKYLLPKIPEMRTSDEADAVAIAICHAQHCRFIA